MDDVRVVKLLLDWSLGLAEGASGMEMEMEMETGQKPASYSKPITSHPGGRGILIRLSWSDAQSTPPHLIRPPPTTTMTNHGARAVAIVKMLVGIEKKMSKRYLSTTIKGFLFQSQPARLSKRLEKSE